MHKNHRQRVKERFLKEGGLHTFEEHQALEFLLFYGIPRKDTNDIAHILLEKYGNIKNLMNADVTDIANTKGMGMHSAMLIKVVQNFCRYYMSTSEGKKQYIRNIEQAVSVIKPLLFGKGYEHIFAFCLDERYALRHFQLLNKGTLSEVQFSIKELIQIAMRFHSEKVLLAHNHPSGTPSPSTADINTTKEAEDTLARVNIKLLDHIILTDSSYYSFSENKILSPDYTSDSMRAAQYSGVWFSEDNK